jgi:xanthine dehydrogenase YagT iron-sulfur-binding subunit
MDKEKTSQNSRRDFLKNTTLITAVALTPPAAIQAADKKMDERFAAVLENVSCSIKVNGTMHTMKIDPRVTLLDFLRERVHLTGTKKGCDYGQCGACTVHVDGHRVNSCLTLAVMTDGKEVTTIEGLAKGDELHPMQAAFIKHDGFQCGYCTPGQIMSAVACIREGHADDAEEIREFMSGNICRCGAYPNIIAAIQEVKNGGHNI